MLSGAWRTRAAEILDGYAASFTMGMGQFCTKPGALIVPEDGAVDVGAKIAAALATVPLGNLLTPGLRAAFQDARDEVAQLPGITTLVPGSDDEVPAPTVFEVTAADVLATPEILERELFGPGTVVVRYADPAQLPALAARLEGQLTATLHADAEDDAAELVGLLTGKAGRVLWNGWPTGVTVSYAQQHGGPYRRPRPPEPRPGTAATRRFQRPVAYQDFPDAALPPALQQANPWRIVRRIDGRFDGVGAVQSAAQVAQ